MLQVIKKKGFKQDFKIEKIQKGINTAMKVGSGMYRPKLSKLITEEIYDYVKNKEEILSSDIDKLVLKKLNLYGQNLTANAFERYKTIKKYQQIENVLDKDIFGIIDGSNSKAIHENANKDSKIFSTQRDLMAGAISRSYTERKILPTYLLNAHNEGLIHFHDTDYMINKGMFNCSIPDLFDMLWNGTVINGKMIERPHSFKTACTIATQISLQIANGQYGGQTLSMSHLAPFVKISYNNYLSEIEENCNKFNLQLTDKDKEEIAYKKLKKEIKDGVQTIQYQENTFSSSNGQTPFVSLFMYLNEKPEYVKETALIIEEILNQRIQGMKNQYGVWTTPAFPKLLYVTDENNIHPNSEYFYLTQLAVKCSSKRMNPDYISAKKMKENYEGNVFPCMGCRSFLSPWKDENGKYKFYGRFNRGVVTINLVDVALSSHKDMEEFWNILDERLELCKEALIIKDKLIREGSIETSPIHWQYGALARLKEGEDNLKYLKNGYSSISLGYIGLYEMTKYMLNVSNTNPEGKEFSYKVICYLEKKTKEWQSIEGLEGCSLYGTPSESLTYKFALKTQKRFGVIKNITDKKWFTNSYHINVSEQIDAFSKIKFESYYQDHSKGGAVSYVELPDMTHNLEALLQVVQYMYQNIQYAEINLTNCDYCGKCGFEGEMKINLEGNWVCPNCGNTDTKKMNISRRVCGYINSSNDINPGKMDEFGHRVKHL